MTENLASLLDLHMKKARVGDARLANQVNSVADNPYFIHRSTVRNWRSGSAQKVNNWRQLATVAVALGLDENEADALLKSAGCPSIQSLTASARESDQALLGFWKNTSASPDEPESRAQLVDNTPVSQAEDEGTNQGKNRPTPTNRKWVHVVAGLLLLVGLTFVVAKASPGIFESLSSRLSGKPRNLLVNSHFEKGKLGWIAYVNDKALASFDIVDEALHVQIEQPAQKSWHIGLNQNDFEVTAGKVYTTRFRYRGDGITTFSVDITRMRNPKTSLSFDSSNGRNLVTAESWTTKTIQFEAMETVTMKDGGARLFFKFGKSRKGLIVLDDVELFEGEIESELPDSSL